MRVSESRAERGTIIDWLECVEVAALAKHGTLKPDQQTWLDTFLTVPPHKYEIMFGSDVSVLKADR